MKVSPEVRAWLLEQAQRTAEYGSIPYGLADFLDAVFADSVADNGRFGVVSDRLDSGDGHLLTPVAQRLGMSPRTLRHLAETGRVRAWQDAPGCRWRVDERSVRTYIEARRAGNAQECGSADGGEGRAGGQAA